MNITFNRPLKVFIDEKTGKTKISISKKNIDGTYENAYINIEFKKDTKIKNNQLINIKNAWLSFYKWEYQNKKGTTWFIKCNDFEEVKATTEENENPDQEYIDFGNSIELEDEDLGW